MKRITFKINRNVNWQDYQEFCCPESVGPEKLLGKQLEQRVIKLKYAHGGCTGFDRCLIGYLLMSYQHKIDIFTSTYFYSSLNGIYLNVAYDVIIYEYEISVSC